MLSLDESNNNSAQVPKNTTLSLIMKARSRYYSLLIHFSLVHTSDTQGSLQELVKDSDFSSERRCMTRIRMRLTINKNNNEKRKNYTEIY